MNDKKFGIFREGCRSDLRGVKHYASEGEKPLGLGEIHYTTGVIHYGEGEKPLGIGEISLVDGVFSLSE